jgi:lambda family phage portal protein
MGWLAGILGRSTRRPAAPRQLQVRARYDAAITNDANRKHWANADGLSADAAATPEVRRTLRNRARYESANNSYAAGIVATLANDVVGTGPRLQVLTDDPDANNAIEQAFNAWARSINLADRLRTMRMARAHSGECFAKLASNPVVPGPVKLDVGLIEADRVASLNYGVLGPYEVDGIVYDASGNPVAYRVLRDHPGDRSVTLASDVYEASRIVHYFMPARPEQHRGIPDLVPALPLFAQLRRYTIAVLSAAETAANFAGTVETDAPANGEADPVEPMDTIELEANSLLTLPAGWKMSQVKPEQPTTSYGEFKREILNEIARCLNMPFNVAAGNSSGYNYASGRLDHQTYFKAIRIDQAHMARTVLDRVLAEWFDEAKLIESLVPPRVRVLESLPHQWFWDGTEHVDPAKEASAQATRLANHTTTLASEFARQGKDWEAELRQRARELALMEELGITVAPSVPAGDTAPTRNDQPVDGPSDEDTNDDQDA